MLGCECVKLRKSPARIAFVYIDNLCCCRNVGMSWDDSVTTRSQNMSMRANQARSQDDHNVEYYGRPQNQVSSSGPFWSRRLGVNAGMDDSVLTDVSVRLFWLFCVFYELSIICDVGSSIWRPTLLNSTSPTLYRRCTSRVRVHQFLVSVSELFLSE